MAETGDGEERERPILVDPEKVKAEDFINLNTVSKRSGMGFPLDGDKSTITPERSDPVSNKIDTDR